jgi:hypothetical protein
VHMQIIDVTDDKKLVYVIFLVINSCQSTVTKDHKKFTHTSKYRCLAN